MVMNKEPRMSNDGKPRLSPTRGQQGSPTRGQPVDQLKGEIENFLVVAIQLQTSHFVTVKNFDLYECNTS